MVDLIHRLFGNIPYMIFWRKHFQNYRSDVPTMDLFQVRRSLSHQREESPNTTPLGQSVHPDCA